MALLDLLNISQSKQTQQSQELTKEQLNAHVEDYQKIISYWRKYPDKFVDYLCSLNPNNTFKFYFIQRVFLRVAMRYKTVFATFSRGFSKSFLAVLSLMLKAVLYPGAKLATAADGNL